MTAMLVDTPTAVVFCVGFLIVAAQSGRHERAQLAELVGVEEAVDEKDREDVVLEVREP